ncbi:MAG: HEPN domain-containing protein [Candidatus Eremiobacteraeota bacterium]|nr:HEPN domain-containing protein [Candidatus Eremiobacteraeota bacterium]
MTLRPKPTIQKALISSTSRFVGEYEKNGMLLAHAWPDFYDRTASTRWFEGPLSRSAFVFIFETPPLIEKSGPVPDYSPMGDLICAYLAVLFGKRFDFHGIIESRGLFHFPNLKQFEHLCDHHLPQNSHSPRVDFPVPLELGQFSRIERLLLAPLPDIKFLRTFQGATKFYLQALRNIEYDPEIAYLHLITAGEILSNYYDYRTEALLDTQTLKVLSKIQEELVNGDRVAKFISKKLLQVKRRFVETIIGLVEKDFFQHSEAKEPFAGLKESSFRDTISAAYDLRSRYVHTGIPFRNLVSHYISGMNNEIMIGKPVVEDKEFGKILAKVPTYLGLERIIRYCLLRFAQLNNAYIEPSIV